MDLLVTDALTEYVKDVFMLKQRYDKTISATQGPDAVQKREELHEKLQDLEDRQARLLEAVEQDLLDPGIVRRRQKEILATQQKVQKELEALSTTDGSMALPAFQVILTLAKGVPNATKPELRRLLEHLAGSIKVNTRKRLLVITWRLGGEIWYRVPQFRGGPGRKVETFKRQAEEQISHFRMP